MMRVIASLALVVFLFGLSLPAYAFRHKHEVNDLPQSEVEMMNRVLTCLSNKDTFAYYNLFPCFDTIWHLVMHNPDNSPEVQHELSELREHPQKLINFDPYYNPSIIWHFIYLLEKGEDSGIHWNGIVLQRFELHKQELTRDEIGLERVIPERFNGYIFVRDMLGNTTYCITIKEIQKIKGYYFGGQLLNVLEASNVEEFRKREHEEAAYFAKLRAQAAKAKRDSAIQDSLRAANVSVEDSILQKNSSDSTIAKGSITDTLLAKTDTLLAKTDTTKNAKKDPLATKPLPDEEANKAKKEIVERKYYEGKFDDEIPAKLYIRYMKDGKTDKISYWDALYKFGDQVSYVKLDVTKSADGKWLLEEPIASMELVLKDKVYTGSWTNNDNQTGYDVVLTEKALSVSLMEKLDKILDQGAWGKTDEQKTLEKKPDPPKEEDDKGNDSN